MIADLHKAGVDYKTINKKLGEKVRPAGLMIQKFKKYKTKKKSETTWKELINELKTVGPQSSRTPLVTMLV